MMQSSGVPTPPQTEEERIRAAYARRKSGARYSWLEPSYALSMQELERAVLGALRRHATAPLSELSVLDVGCGSGTWLQQFVKWGASPANLVGIDLLPDRLEEARRRCAPGIRFQCESATALRLDAKSVDVVLQFTMFSSILDPAVRQQVASEMVRVLRPAGCILWHDFHVDNPRNSDVRGLRRGDIIRLFPQCRVELAYATLAPPLARAIARVSISLCRALAVAPWLRTHYFGVIQKRS